MLEEGDTAGVIVLDLKLDKEWAALGMAVSLNDIFCAGVVVTLGSAGPRAVDDGVTFCLIRFFACSISVSDDMEDASCALVSIGSSLSGRFFEGRDEDINLSLTLGVLVVVIPSLDAWSA